MNKKVVIITGGGKGIGFGVAMCFAKNNYNVVITGRTKETLDKAKLELEKYTDVLAIVADGKNEADVKNIVNETINKFGKINCLINNAQASCSGKMLIEHSDEDFYLAIDSGLMGTFHYMRECYPYLKESKGSVINFASAAGLFGRVGQSSYAAAKEGIRGLSRVAASEWGPDNINVNVICPLVMSEELAKWKSENPDLYHKTIGEVPMMRFGDAETDIGRVCLFLDSDAASYLTGECLTLQGGLGLRP